MPTPLRRRSSKKLSRASEGTHYRVGVINDHRDSFSFVEYREYGARGEMKVWSASSSSGPMPTRPHPDDAVHVFLNLKKVGTFKSSVEAQALIDKLLAEAPVDLTEYSDVLRCARPSRTPSAKWEHPEQKRPS